MNHNLGILGIARKAGLLAIGGDAVNSAARNGKAQLIITTCDASEGSARRAKMCADSSGAVYTAVHYTKDEIGSITGRGSPGTIAILDAGLAAGFMKGLAELQPDRYTEPAEQLVSTAEALKERKKTTAKRRTAQ